MQNLDSFSSYFADSFDNNYGSYHRLLKLTKGAYGSYRRELLPKDTQPILGMYSTNLNSFACTQLCTLVPHLKPQFFLLESFC